VVFVTLVQNLSPLLIALFSFILYKVKLNKVEVGVLCTSFVGFVILVLGSFKGAEESAVGSDTKVEIEIIIACIMMVMIPFNGAVI
jgi:drug/metabolite transporter (DMT)-like permease